MADLGNTDSASKHPLKEVLKWLPEEDFAVLGHRFASHGRDYEILVQDMLGSDPGTHELTFTHCVECSFISRVGDWVWRTSWSDEFTDYKRWEEAGEPEGYVWGTNWSAVEVIDAVADSESAKDWSDRLGKPMYEAELWTDRFRCRLVFHSIRTRKINDSTDTIAKVILLIDW